VVQGQAGNRYARKEKNQWARARLDGLLFAVALVRSDHGLNPGLWPDASR